MAWVKIDDQFFDHPKMRAAGKDGRALFVAALAHASSQLTDGLIPDYDLKLVAAKADVRPGPTARRLEDVNAWHRHGHSCDRCPPCPPDAFLIHDYHAYQPSAEQQRKRRREVSEAKARAGRAGAAARWGHPEPDGTTDDTDDGTTDSNTDGTDPPSAITGATSKNGPVPVPVPPLCTSSSSSTRVPGPHDDDDHALPSDLWDRYAAKKLQAQRKPPDHPQRWKQTVATNARLELTDRAHQLLAQYRLTTSQLVDVLLSDTNPAWLNGLRRPA